jgi:hypothetical protein
VRLCNLRTCESPLWPAIHELSNRRHFFHAPGPYLATNAGEPGIADRHRKLASRLLIVLNPMVEVRFDIAHLVTPSLYPDPA